MSDRKKARSAAGFAVAEELRESPVRSRDVLLSPEPHEDCECIADLNVSGYPASLAATKGIQISAVVLCNSGAKRRVAPGP
jgi:hypothetical protein